jgi:hypothetical protein
MGLFWEKIGLGQRFLGIAVFHKELTTAGKGWRVELGIFSKDKVGMTKF